MEKLEGASDDSNDFGAGINAENNTTDVFRAKYNFKIGIYGWRKRCLYILILVLLVMVIVNLALTLWVLKVMEFSSEGMGQLRIVSGGLKLDGKAFVLNSLVTSTIKSRAGQPIIIESSANFSFSSRNKQGLITNKMALGNNGFECLASNFRVIDERGSILFSVGHQEVVVGAEILRVSGEGGTYFKGSVQTGLVRAESGSELRMESSTRSLGIHGPQGIHVESRGGEMQAMALNDISLKSEQGTIRLESNSVLLPDLPTALPTTTLKVTSKAHHSNRFQLCVCNSGRLYLASSNFHCASGEDDTVCR